MTILVLGAPGFIGSAVVREAKTAGLDVYPTARSSGHEMAICDIQDEAQIARAIEESRASVVVNCVGAGATAGSDDDQTIWSVNAGGTTNLLSVLESFRSSASGDHLVRPRLIHIGSSREIHTGVSAESRGATSGVYAESKAHSAKLLSEYLSVGNSGLDLAVHNTYGPSQPKGRFVAQATSSAASGQLFQLLNPNQVHDFVWVEDVAQAVIAAALSDRSTSEPIEIGTGMGTSVLNLARLCYEIAEQPLDLIEVSEFVEGESEAEVADVNQAAQLLGWRAKVTLPDGLRRIIKNSSAFGPGSSRPNQSQGGFS